MTTQSCLYRFCIVFRGFFVKIHARLLWISLFWLSSLFCYFNSFPVNNVWNFNARIILQFWTSTADNLKWIVSCIPLYGVLEFIFLKSLIAPAHRTRFFCYLYTFFIMHHWLYCYFTYALSQKFKNQYHVSSVSALLYILSDDNCYLSSLFLLKAVSVKSFGASNSKATTTSICCLRTDR